MEAPQRLDRLPPELGPVAEAVQRLGGAYLVGGTVRDLLLGSPSADVDLAVVGDGVAFARRLARELGGRVTAHGAFGTAVVRLGSLHVDVVTARSERYPEPAALPEVSPGSLEDDLRRRDFTINALAASLRAEDLGTLVDPHGGRLDLERGAVRVLHDASFVDDPTRILRAIRYESRLGFRMDEHTEALARAGVAGIGLLSGARVREELVALLDERQAAASVVRLGELAAARAIHPGLAAGVQPAAVVGRVVELRDRYGVDVPRWRPVLAVLARGLARAELSEWLGALKLRRVDARAVASAVRVAPQLASLTGVRPSQLAALAREADPDAPLVALALSDSGPLHDYFAASRHVRLEITGADLAALGLEESPRVGEILDELLARKLDGRLDGRASELAAARELLE